MANCNVDTCTCARFVCCSHVLLLFPIARRRVSEVGVKCRKSFCLRWKWFLEDCVERFIKAFEVGVCIVCRSYCTRWSLSLLTRCGRKTKEPRHWTQRPLSPLTPRCGRKTKQPSHCARWWLLSEQPNGMQRTKPCIIVLPIQCWMIILPINLARADRQQNVLWDAALHFSLRTTGSFRI